MDTGMRIDELTNLLISNVDLDRGQVHVRQTKNKKDRYITMSSHAVRGIKKHLTLNSPRDYLFESPVRKGMPISKTRIRTLLKEAVGKAGIKKEVCVHTLRHTYATHQLEAGQNIMVLKESPWHKLRVLDALHKCRTEYMGGHIEACEDCGEVRLAYNSCRNRHCPKCGAIEKERWIINREADLLSVKYFHVVFTVPDKLNSLFLNNQVAMFNLLFTIVWDVIKDFGKTKKWIGDKIGAMAILHTSGQNLNYHPHLHLIVPAGALMPNGKWKHSRKKGKYLFKVDQLSDVFRARFVKQIRELKKNGGLSGQIPNGLFDNDWVVYAKQPFGGAKQVINYLSRYTHRTAISNERIINVDDKNVTFTWKDYRNNYAKQTTILPGEEFLRLFCMHILPPGFMRIRHYGFFSNASKRKSLAIIRKSLNAIATPVTTKKPWQEIAFERMGIKPGVCNCCGGKMVIIKIVPNRFAPGKRAPPDKEGKRIVKLQHG